MYARTHKCPFFFVMISLSQECEMVKRMGKSHVLFMYVLNSALFKYIGDLIFIKSVSSLFFI